MEIIFAILIAVLVFAGGVLSGAKIQKMYMLDQKSDIWMGLPLKTRFTIKHLDSEYVITRYTNTRYGLLIQAAVKITPEGKKKGKIVGII